MHSLWSTRRSFLGATAGFAFSRSIAFGQMLPLRIGVTDWNLNLGARPETVTKAAELGFRGVQVSFGRELVDGKMPADHPEVLARYVSLSQKHGVTIDGTCVDRLHAPFSLHRWFRPSETWDGRVGRIWKRMHDRVVWTRIIDGISAISGE
jgi:hypothetical protein